MQAQGIFIGSVSITVIVALVFGLAGAAILMPGIFDENVRIVDTPPEEGTSLEPGMGSADIQEPGAIPGIGGMTNATGGISLVRNSLQTNPGTVPEGRVIGNKGSAAIPGTPETLLIMDR